MPQRTLFRPYTTTNSEGRAARLGSGVNLAPPLLVAAAEPADSSPNRKHPLPAQGATGPMRPQAGGWPSAARRTSGGVRRLILPSSRRLLLFGSGYAGLGECLNDRQVERACHPE